MNNYLTVTALNRYLKHVMDNDLYLQDVYLKGEISNFKPHGTGHFYFSLKDESGRVNAIMFKFNTSKLKFKPVDGMHVLVHGKISVYEATGNYQIYIDEMLEDGVGNLYVAYEQLKQKLLNEGLFAAENKSPIPLIPKKIGIITALSGAAIRDILTTLKRRFPLVEILVFPTLVQGEGAKESIVKSIEAAQNYNLDTLIIGRGGGSIEDLWAFNEEIVARAIAASQVPIISAVGHETDITIADLVADLRAPTPTAAAELAVPDRLALINEINNNQLVITAQINKLIDLEFLRLNRVKDSFIIKNIETIYEPKFEKLTLIIERLQRYMKEKITDLTYQHQTLIEKLIILNPLQTLNRGYAIVKLKDQVISSVKNININDELGLELSDGIANVSVLSKELKK